MKYLIEIKNDLFDISSRLKSVKDTYVLYFNPERKRFEVHDEAQRGGTLAFVSPYDELDCRTVDYALYTRVQNARRVFEDIERSNSLLLRQNAAKQTEKQLEKYLEKE